MLVYESVVDFLVAPCESGQLDAAKWMLDTFQFKDEIGGSFNAGVLISATCEHEHYHIAEWFVNEMELNRQDLIEVLRMSQDNNDIKTVAWLTETLQSM